MSLHALAGHMATKGRGGDSMLVHMTPEEVQSLQAMALKGGGSLTINPETGLPEANFLKKMLPMIAGAALNFFAPGVGTAVGGMFGLGAAAGTGIAVGGLSALATGSLSRGLMAGLGAYGGASLAGGLANAGTGAMSAEAGNAALAAEGLTGEAALSPAADDIAQRAIGERLASATPYDKLATGFKAVTDSPAAFGNFAKNNIGAGLAAISAINADEGVQTATPRQDTGTIRNYTFDPYGQTYTSAGNYPASEYKGMAQGGIVALAAGGTSDQPLYLGLDKGSSAADVAAAYSQFAGGAGGDTAANQREAVAFLQSRGIGDDIITQGYQQFLSPVAQAASAGPAAGSDAYNTMVGNWFNQNPNATAADISSAISTYGLNSADVVNAMRASGLSNAALYSAFHPDVGVPDTPMGGLAGLSSNINDWLSKYPTAKRAEAERAMDTWGYKEQDVIRATGKTLDELFKEQKKVVVPGPITTVTKLPDGVGGGGNTYVNPNGTITTRPNIPGIPEGGFTGMGQLRDIYEQRGGSLGYVNPAPKTMEEFEQRFNRQTGDSLAAYEHLMGKGANPIKSGAEQIMRPYNEVVTGIPAAEGRPTQKYIFQNGRYVENPNYRPLSYNSAGERVVGLTPSEVIKGITPFKDGKNDAGLFDFVTQNNISEAQLAAALGISIAEARARLAAARKKSTAATNANVQTDNSGYGGGDDGPGPGDTSGTPGASGSADGTAGGCVDPNVMVLLAGGGQVRAGDLRVGDMLHTLHEDTFVYGDFPVEFVEIIQQPKVEAVFDNQKIIVSTTHKFLTADGVWKQMRDLAVGDVVRAAGGDTKTLTGVTTLGEGPVVKMTVTDAHTYIADGLVSHNKARGGIVRRMALGGLGALAGGGSASQYNLGGYSDGGRLLRGPGDGVSDSIPATIGDKQPARLADGEFVVPARIVSELGNGSTEAGARKLYAMMDRVQKARGKTTGKSRVAANTRADKYLPA
jgi:hypothetical protein